MPYSVLPVVQYNNIIMDLTVFELIFHAIRDICPLFQHTGYFLKLVFGVLCKLTIVIQSNV